MPRTPDRFPGGREEESLTLEDTTTQPTVNGEFRHDAGSLYAKDSVGVFNLRSGSGLSESQHETLDTLVHNIAEDSYDEIVRSGSVVTNLITWTDSGKTTKIREEAYTRAAGKVTQIDIIQYDGAGTEDYRITEAYTRTAGKVTSITRTRT